MNLSFSRFAALTAKFTGNPKTFAFCCLLILVWAACGPLFHFSDTWQLVINTGTTIITFLMVVLLQNSQNRDMAALHAKLDEMLLRNPQTRNTVVAVDDLDEEHIQKMREQIKGEAVKPSLTSLTNNPIPSRPIIWG